MLRLFREAHSMRFSVLNERFRDFEMKSVFGLVWFRDTFNTGDYSVALTDD